MMELSCIHDLRVKKKRQYAHIKETISTINALGQFKF